MAGVMLGYMEKKENLFGIILTTSLQQTPPPPFFLPYQSKFLSLALHFPTI